MNNPPPFYLTSTEIRPTLNPRKCTLLQVLWSEERKDHFLRIKIDPPLIGGYLRIDNEAIDEVVVAARHSGYTVYPLNNFPITVYVCYILNDLIRSTGQVLGKDLQILFIGELYINFEEAEKAIEFEPMRI